MCRALRTLWSGGGGPLSGREDGQGSKKSPGSWGIRLHVRGAEYQGGKVTGLAGRRKNHQVIWWSSANLQNSRKAKMQRVRKLSNVSGGMGLSTKVHEPREQGGLVQKTALGSYAE